MTVALPDSITLQVDLIFGVWARGILEEQYREELVHIAYPFV